MLDNRFNQMITKNDTGKASVVSSILLKNCNWLLSLAAALTIFFGTFIWASVNLDMTAIQAAVYEAETAILKSGAKEIEGYGSSPEQAVEDQYEVAE